MKRKILLLLMVSIIGSFGIGNRINTQAQRCEVDGCTILGEHTHSNCDVEGCTISGEHAHSNCEVEGCTISSEHAHEHSNGHQSSGHRGGHH